MVKTSKRIPALLLLAGQLALVSCGSGEGPDTTPAAAEVPETAAVAVETDPYEAYREIDCRGRRFCGLIRSQFAYEFDVEEQTGDVVNDAVFDRQAKVEELLNADLTWHQQPGAYTDQTAFVETYRTSVLAQDGSFDYIIAAANHLIPRMGEGLFTDLTTVDTMHLAEDCYSAGFRESLTIDGSLYLLTGSLSLNCLENMCVLFFNKDLTARFGYTAPYEEVRAGSWTFDKLNAMVVDTYQDTNGSGTADDQDVYGYLTYNNMINAQLIGMGLTYFEDRDGIPVIKETPDEHLITIYEKVERFMNESEATYHYNDTTNNALLATEAMLTIWDGGNVLFFPSVLSSAVKMRDTAFDFGILPFPKADESQSGYRTFLLENVSVFGIPPSVDAVSSGTVLELLSLIGARELNGIYFDIAMKSKYSRDADTKDMLDVIRAGVFFEYPLMTQFVGQCIYGKKPLVSSYLTEVQTGKRVYDRLIENCAELKK